MPMEDTQATVTADPTVTIASGVVVGTTRTPINQPSPSAVLNAYLGVPFAKSPPKRFSAPEEPEAWENPLLAQALAPRCPQQELRGNSSLESYLAPTAAEDVRQSEVCLYLNVYAPQSASTSNPNAVMFWTHGANLGSGSASESSYTDPAFSINEDIIIVTTNYRLGFFGFSNSPEIPLGQQNSGGDPTEVTVFGSSAGGFSTKQLVATPPSPLPFYAAIMESQTAALPEDGAANYQNVSQHFGCTDINCLRNVPMHDLQNYILGNNLFFYPSVDNVTCVSDIRKSIDKGTSANVPIILGTNANELSGLVYQISDNGTADVDSTLNEICHAVVPVMVTDTVFTCPTGAIANYTSEHSYCGWRYRYSASFNDTGTFPGEGATHGSEVPIVFGTYPVGGATDQKVVLSHYMQHAWASFAKNPGGGPGWPQVGTNGGIELADIGSGDSSGETDITFWEADSYCGTLLGYSDLLGFSW
ncbi:alpha/beta-hydrolase [Aspergillus californicus]